MSQNGGNEGLFPKKSSGWITLALLIVSYYSIYYLFLYPDLNHKSMMSLQQPAEANYCRNVDNEEQIDLVINYRVPYYLSAYSDNAILFTIVNKTPEYINNFILRLDNKKSNSLISTIPIQTNNNLAIEDSYYRNYLVFDIPAHGTVTGILWISLIDTNNQGDVLEFQYFYLCPDITNKVNANIDRNEDGPFSINLEIDDYKSLTNAIISAILLPPWANGLLLVLALVVIKLVEDFIPPYEAKSADYLYIVLSNLRDIGIYFLGVIPISLIIFGSLWVVINLEAEVVRCIFIFIAILFVLLISLLVFFWKKIKKSDVRLIQWSGYQESNSRKTKK